MIKSLIVGVFILSVPIFALAQTKANDAIAQQLKLLHAEKSITLSFDGNTSKVMAVSENFVEREANQAGVQAMNFALGFFYPGNSLQKSPDKILFSIWALTKKPRFANAHKLVIETGGRAIDLGDARYVAKPRENLEYLNYEITLRDLGSIAESANTVFRIGTREFTMTSEQLKLIRNFSKIADFTAIN